MKDINRRWEEKQNAEGVDAKSSSRDKVKNQGALGLGNRTCIRTVIKIAHPIVSLSAIGIGVGRIHLFLLTGAN